MDVQAQYRSVKLFALSLSKGRVAGQQGFDKLSPNGIWCLTEPYCV